MSDLHASLSAMTSTAKRLAAHSILQRLRKPGAHLTSDGAPADTVKLIEPLRRVSAPGVLLPMAMIDRLLAAGWLILETQGSARQLRLSPDASERLAKLKVANARLRTPLLRRPPSGNQVRAPSFRRQPVLSPLDAYTQRRDRNGRPILSSAQREAGERLAADFIRGQLLPRVTAQWSAPAQSKRTRRTTPGAGVEIADSVAAARQRVTAALDAVGSELAGVMIDVCCFEMRLEETERSHDLPQRSAKVVLQLGLTRLARHYGIIAPIPPPAAKPRHWGAEHFRPTLDAWRDR